MNGEDFEFYRDLEPSKLKDPKMEEFRYIKVNDDDPFGLKKNDSTTKSDLFLEFAPKKIEKVEKTSVKRKRKKSTTKMKSRRVKAFIVAFSMLVGYGVHSLVDFVKPYINDYHQYESNRITIANLYESYRVTKEGNERSYDLTYVTHGLFYDGPEEVDFDKSVTIDANGEKSGPAVDYYDGLDRYVAKRNGGKGYYETVYEMNMLAEKLPLIEPDNAGPYTPDEIERMFGKTEENKYGQGKTQEMSSDGIFTESELRSLGGK